MEPSDHWEHYLATIGDHQGSIVYDEGISARINDIALPNSIMIRLTFKDVYDNGLPTQQEFERISPLEEIIETTIFEHGGQFLGRVTYGGARYMLGLAPDPSDALEGSIQAECASIDYQADITVEPDPNKDIYWTQLYPTPDDRQVISDLKVINSLTENGDVRSAIRPIDHWSYFGKKAAANEFAEWAEAEGFTIIGITKEKQSLFSSRWLVSTQKESDTELGSVTTQTIAHNRKANELGGEYDGWETRIVTADEAEKGT